MFQSTSTRAHKGNGSPSKNGVSKRAPTSSSSRSLQALAEKVVRRPEILNYSNSDLSITPPVTTTLSVSSAHSDITATYSQDAGHISSAGQSDGTDQRDSNVTARNNVTVYYDPVYLEIPSDIPDLERELLEGHNRLQRNLLYIYDPIPNYYTLDESEINSATDHNIPIGHSKDSKDTSTTDHSSSMGHNTITDDNNVTDHEKLARPAALPGTRGVVKDKSSIRSRLVKAQQEMKKQKNAGITMGQNGSTLFPPTEDDTIPSSPDEHETLVDGLVAAMLNNRDCLEVETEEFTTRWGDGAIYYTPEDMRAAIEELIVSPPSP
ncbi:hypothetical protein J1614_010777 [Plenodomus biglobosus]|nr:hypothetical protein J1614_010777 [Plenodomus biglobosus]